MSFIQVPIGKGITKFPNIKRSQPEFIPQQKEKSPELTASTEGAWLKSLADQGKLRVIVGGGAGVATETVITPASGETFHLIGASGDASGAGSLTLRAIVGGDSKIIDVMRFTTEQLNAEVKNARGFSLVGNGIDILQWTLQAGASYNDRVLGYIENTETQSSRGTTRIIEI